MSLRWPWEDFLHRKEAAEVGGLDAEIRCMRRAIGQRPAEDRIRAYLQKELDGAQMRRQRLVNRGTQRAKLAAQDRLRARV
jgi:hypothetical protein